MKQPISETQKHIDSTSKSLKTFKVRLDYYNTRIRHGQEDLPRLMAQIEEIKVGMPEWLEQTRVLKLSISGHETRLEKQLKRIDLLKEKAKILKKLKVLEE